jgi:NADH-quinone oxidoreductase subunit G
VGALTVREFRFRSRVWYLEKTKSVCPGCNVGCNTSIESRDDVVYRFLPRLNPEVNDYWLCDHGRFLAESLNSRDVHKATVRDGSAVAEAIVPAAIERAASEIRRTVADSGPANLFFLGSAHLSNEENFLLRKIADHLSCPNRDTVVDRSRPHKIKSRTEWVEGEEAAANFRGARDMGLVPGKGGYGLQAILDGKASPEVILVADADLSAMADGPEKVAALRRARFLAVAARTANALTRAADVVLPAASLAEKEGTFTNVQGRVQKFERAFLPRPPIRAHWELLLLLGLALGWGDRSWTPQDLLRQIAREVEGYADVTADELEGGVLIKKGDFVWAGPL